MTGARKATWLTIRPAPIVDTFSRQWKFSLIVSCIIRGILRRLWLKAGLLIDVWSG
ncbi:hypothetical protein ABHI18_001556 [Aspergillus niger]